MLLRPSNTLILDEPTNHLDIDSTDVLLEALEAFGGTLILVSHDRYFVDRLATKVLDIGGGDAVLYPGTYEEFRWSRTQAAAAGSPPSQGPMPAAPPPARRQRDAAAVQTATHQTRAASPSAPPTTGGTPPTSAVAHKRRQVEARRQERRSQALRKRIAEFERRIAEREAELRTVEAEMAAPNLYADQAAANELVRRQQALMWDVGDLMNQWEALEREAAERERAAVTPAGGSSDTPR